ncbi:hypothetical protein P879_08017 [Paragonimus westermani]|uniref:Uncharacterized protein n=1 Tax=Paragonimus westermani TaxID=34504 RepID=A0A8T0DEV5_9TREM|nr:hypothetical protein P879_08017 [Paragonimus westermani]
MRENTTIPTRLAKIWLEEKFEGKLDEKCAANTARPSYSKTSHHDEQAGTVSYSTPGSYRLCMTSSFLTINLENQYNRTEPYRLIGWKLSNRFRSLVQNQLDKAEECHFANVIVDNTSLVQSSTKVNLKPGFSWSGLAYYFQLLNFTYPMLNIDSNMQRSVLDICEYTRYT